MIHLRIVTSTDKADRAVRLLGASESVSNIVHLPGAARHPKGDLILCDVRSEDASLLVSDLKDLGVPVGGSITLQAIDSQISEGGMPKETSAGASEAVVWQDVETRTQEMASLSAEFMVFMVLAMLIAEAGILQATSILLVGAMIVGPDFGAVAGTCLAVVEMRGRLALRSLSTLVVGFSAGIVVAGLITLGLESLSAFPAHLVESPSTLPSSVSSVVGPPNVFTFFVAFCAGIVGMLSLSTAKSGAIIGVLVSVTTIPAGANVALSAAYRQWSTVAGSAEQLGANILTLLVAGILTLAAQRGLFSYYRRQEDGHDQAREAAGLPPRRTRPTRKAAHWGQNR